MADFLGIRTKSGNIVQPPGEPMIHKFDFTFATPNLNNGVTIYTPTPGDILIDSWFEIDTAFDGTTPLLDLSQFLNGPQGWYAYAANGPLDATVEGSPKLDSGGSLSAQQNITYTASGPMPGTPEPPALLSQAANNYLHSHLGAFDVVSFARIVPAKLTTANPIKLVLSQDGTKGGAAAGSTVGAGTAYLYVGTPV